MHLSDAIRDAYVGTVRTPKSSIKPSLGEEKENYGGSLKEIALSLQKERVGIAVKQKPRDSGSAGNNQTLPGFKTAGKKRG